MQPINNTTTVRPHWHASIPLLAVLLFLGIPTAIVYALPVQSMPPQIKVGVDAAIPPAEFDFTDTMTHGNAQLVQLVTNGGEAIAELRAGNDQAGEATAVVGVNLDFIWDDPPYSGTIIEDAIVRVEVDLEYQIDASPDPVEGSALAEIAIDPASVADFKRTQVNGQEQSPITHVFTTTVGEMPPTLLFRATAQVTAGDPGGAAESRANARINVAQVRLLFNPDIIAMGLEVTQGLQNLQHSVDLIANKPTYVRLYSFVFRPEDAPLQTAAQLRVTKGGQEVLLDPIGVNRVMHNPTRSLLQDSFVFKLPNNFLSGSVTVKGEINHTNNGRARAPEEMLTTNNDIQKTVTFDAASNLNLTILDMQYRTCANCPLQSIPATDSQRLVDWLSVGYPVPTVNFRTRTFSMTTINPSSADILRDVRKIRRSEINDNPRNRCSIYIGLADDVNGTNFIRGLADIGKYTAMSPAGATFPGSGDNDGSYADWYGAHEIGHALGRKHVACRGEAGIDPNFPQLSPIRASISQIASLDPFEQTYGFNWNHRNAPGGATILQPYDQNYRDVMSYCQAQWVSEYTYEALRTEISKLAARCASPVVTTTNYLLVSGLITVTEGITTAQLDPLYILPTAVMPTLDSDGATDIVLRGSADNELARYPFTPDEIHDDTLDPNGSHSTTERLLIDELVPYVAGTVTVEIETASGVIASITAGATDPSITVTGPSSRAAEQTITWTANDVDGDNLHFIVQYSPDGGQTWQTLAVDLTGNSFTVDTDSLSAGTQAQFRVLASDGIHTTAGDSATFVVANHAPAATITFPADNSTFATGQTVGLQGMGYDADSGSLEESELSWSSNLDGALGMGSARSISGLSVGTHTITLSADDGVGGLDTAQITLNIVASLSELPPTPAMLTTAPSVLALDNSDILSGTVTVESTGDALNWTATTSDAWLQLSALSGTSGDVMTILVNDAGLSNTVHAGTISVTNSADANDQQFITVIYDKSNVPTAIAGQEMGVETFRPILLIAFVLLLGLASLSMKHHYLLSFVTFTEVFEE